MKKMGSYLLFGLVLLLLGGAPAMAHKVNIFAYAEGGKIYTESYFPDGRPVEGGKVRVLNGEAKELATCTTDTAGRCEFPIPAVADLTIEIEASMGHRNSYLLKRGELEAGK